MTRVACVALVLCLTACSGGSGSADSGLVCSGNPLQACGRSEFCPPTWQGAESATCGPPHSSVGSCNGFGVAIWGEGDVGTVAWYDLDGGALVAVITSGGPMTCAGPEGFTLPSPCSTTTNLPACDAGAGSDGGLPDGG